MSGSANHVAVNFAHALSALARDLFNPMSESGGDAFHPFTAAMESSSKLTPDTFRGALGIAPRFKIDLSSADEFFQNNEDPNNTGDEEVAQTYVVLEMIMHAALSDVSIAWARGRNVVRVRTYIFGRMKNGTLVGLRTMSTET